MRIGGSKGVVASVASKLLTCKLRLGFLRHFLFDFFLYVYEAFDFGDVVFILVALSVFCEV